MGADEQAPSAGRIRYYATDGTLLRVVEDDDIEGVVAPGEAVIDLAGCPDPVNHMTCPPGCTVSDLPDCTARIDTEHGSYTCVFKAGHNDGECSEWHASGWGLWDCYVWNDGSPGATPHHRGIACLT